MSKFLSNVSKGRVATPFKVVLYGPEGVGKSTFGSEAPSPIFMDVEGGTDELDIQRLPKIETFADALSAIDELTTEEHPYKTYVLDTVDWLESLIWKHVCSEHKVEAIEDIGYGKGYNYALDFWRVFLSRLDALHEKRGMHLILLAHSHIRSFRNPVGEDYEKYELKLNNKAAGVVKEWPKAVLFARYQTYTHTDKNKRTRGVGDGSRIISTEPRAAWDAKNRYGLPEEIPLSWAEFETAARAGAPVDVKNVSEEIAQLMAAADPKVRSQAEDALRRADGDSLKLSKLVDWLRGKVSKAA